VTRASASAALVHDDTARNEGKDVPPMTVMSRRSLIGAASAAGACALAAGFLTSRSGAALAASSALTTANTGTVPPTPAAGEAATIPDTTVGQELVSWVDAVNSHDPETLIAHYEAFGMGDMAEGLAANDLLHAQTWGALTVHRIDDATETRLTALLEATLSEEWLSLTMEHDGEHQISLAEPLPGAFPSEPLDDETLSSELRTYIDKLAAADVFSGAVLVARNGNPVFTDVRGSADVAAGAANQLATRFNLGSINKMFTAVAIAQLVEQGTLSFNDTLATVIPDYPNQDVAAQVTIHHLLTHTAGLGDIFGPEFDEAKESLSTLQDYLNLFVDEPLKFVPGERHEYSNAGFIVLGLIIEAVTGRDYFDHIREAVFAPAGMSATDWFERDADTPNRATGYTRDLPPDPRALTIEMALADRVSNVAFIEPFGSSAGGGYSTVEDLLRFETALHGTTLLTADTVATLIEGKVDTPRHGVKYGYGFEDDRSGPARIVGHTGGAPGINAALDMYWDLGSTVAVLANYDFAAHLVSMKARRLLTPPQ
jgi:CubicO group peptidase (beta-lactamase class C family)